MAVSSDELLKQQLATSVQQALQTQIVDGNHCLLIRFYSDLTTVNSKAHQASLPIGQRPTREELVEKAALHMYAGKTEGSYFISFSEDITALLNAISGTTEVSWSVRSIIIGDKPELYGKPKMENIARPPAQFIGIFKVQKADIIKWSDKDLMEAVNKLRSANKQYMDLKMNFYNEHEVVAYYPGAIEAPVATISNPFYPVYMSKVTKN